MALDMLSPPLQGSSALSSMDSGLNTLLCHLMSNASADSAPSNSIPQGSDMMTMSYSSCNYQIHYINHILYQMSQQDHVGHYTGVLVDSSANGGMAGTDTCLLATVPHAHVDITGVGSNVLECLPLVQCASVVDTIDEGKIMLIMSPYAHKPNAKTIHSKPQLEQFGSLVHDSTLNMGAGK